MQNKQENGIKWTLTVENWPWGDSHVNHSLLFGIRMGLGLSNGSEIPMKTPKIETNHKNNNNNKSQENVMAHIDGWNMEMPVDFVVFNPLFENGSLIENGVEINIEPKGNNQIINFKFRSFDNHRTLVFDPTITVPETTTTTTNENTTSQLPIETTTETTTETTMEPTVETTTTVTETTSTPTQQNTEIYDSTETSQTTTSTNHSTGIMYAFSEREKGK